MSGPHLYDRVRETTSTTGTGTITLAGAVSGYRSFSVVGNGNTCFYTIVNGSAWETGIGTYTSSGTTLSRDLILASSNTGAVVNLSGSSQVFLSAPAASLMARVTSSFNGSGSGLLTAAGQLSYSLAALKWVICSGTSADYTVTLPAASSCADSYVALRMSNALTKLVTVEGNSSETIDGALNRIMWAGETAVLWCDGSNWFKVAGVSRPMIARIGLNNTQSISSTTVTTVTFNRNIFDATGLMVNTSSNRLDVKRSGLYALSFSMEWQSINAAATRLQTFPLQNGATGLFNSDMSAAVGAAPTVIGSRYVQLSAGDYMQIQTYQDTGLSQTLYGAASGSTTELALAETSLW